MNGQKVAIVTGANRGLGRALAVGFAADGFHVAAMARSIDQLHSIAKEAKVDSSAVLPIELDLSNIQSIVSAVRAIPRDFGRIDVLVNNAGLGRVGTLGVSTEQFDSLLAVNLSGPFRLLKEVVPLMIEGNAGTILNVASRAGIIGFPNFGAYGASKFGMVGLSESLYRELAPRGIKVTALCPSWIDTDMARESGTPLSSEEMIQTEDLMKTVRWLLSLSPAACVREVMIECRADIS
jgi:NAD(P)-dependent dehydrogenase (short-subunit alcohol dehydrogenase family)